MGEATVASCVVFGPEGPEKSQYRRFNITGVEPGDDYGAMRQVLERRYRRQQSGEGHLPDIVLIDGGKGQLSAALDVMRNLGLQQVPLAGLAKQNEELFVQDQSEPIVLGRTSQSLYLVQRIRDEAHRFGITYHRKVRSDRTFKSALDEIPGIGPKRKQVLMKHFGSVRAISAASVEDLAALEGMTRDAAEKVKEYIGRIGS